MTRQYSATPILFSALLAGFTSLSVGNSEAKTSSKKASLIEDELKLRAGDEQGNELKALKTELLVMRSEKRALEQLEKLLKRHKGTRMEPEVLFRLGEIHMRRARSERFFEVHRDSNQLARFAPEMVTSASEKKQIRKAIQIYLDLEARFPRFRARDLVVFNTAYAYQQIGDELAAEKQFLRLLSQHPNSNLVPDSLLSLGEIQFSRRQFVGALNYFVRIKEYPNARVYPYGLYKAAWAKYNMQDEGGGLKLLEEVVAFGHARAQQGPEMAKLDLRKEALGDMALFFSEIRKAGEAVPYFVSQSRDIDPVPFVLRLVEIYKRHSKYTEVDTVLRDILNQLPKTNLIADVHDELVWNADRQKRRDVAVQHLVSLDKVCEEIEARAACDAKVIEIAKKLGAKLHAYWKKDKLSETADQALKAYEIYLGNTQLVGHEAAQVRFAYADLLFARNQFRAASQNYALVIEESQSSQAKKIGFDLLKTDQKLAIDSVYGAVVALEKAVGDGKWSDADESEFAKLSDRYLKISPRGPFAVDIRFKRAFIAYEKKNFDFALGAFRQIGWTKESFDHPRAAKAQDLYLDILNIRKDFKGLKEASQQLLAIAEGLGSNGGKAMEKSRQEHLAKIRREAWFAEIGEAEAKASNRAEVLKAVEMYRTFAVQNKLSDLAPKAWWNASQLLFRSNELAAAANMCAQMPKEFPGVERSKDCLLQAAQTYESIARLDLASQVASSLAEIDSGKGKAWRSLASEFLAITGNRSAKETAFKEILKSVDDRAEKGQGDKGGLRSEQSKSLEKAFQLAKELNDDRLMSSVRGKIESLNIEPQASRMLVEEAEAVYRSGDSNRAFNLAKRVVGRESQLAMDKSLPARARFLQARVLEDEYRQQSVKARVDRIGIVLAIKTEKLEKSQKAYQSAARMGDPGIAIEAQAKLADLYVDYARTVRSMKLPADVPAADQAVFSKEIEQIALPMEEKGIEALAQAIDAAKKTSRLDGLAGQLQRRLDQLNLKSDVSQPLEIEKLPKLVPGFERGMLGKMFEGSPR